MSMFWCDECGCLKDSDFEPCFEHDGEQHYNSGLICEDCWLEKGEEDEQSI